MVSIIFVLIGVIIALISGSCSDKQKENTVDLQTGNSQETQTQDIQTEEVTEEVTQEVSESSQEETEPVTEEVTEDDVFTSEKYAYDKIYQGDLVIVNADYDYKFPEGDTTLLTVFDNKNHNYNASDYSVTLDAWVIESLNRMMTAFLKEENRENSNIWIIDGYRTKETQEEKYQNGESVFEAGHSEYHTGRTFDMSVIDDDGNHYAFSAEGEYEWFAENASKYGFIIRFPDDKKEITGENPRPRTYRYVGYPHSRYMYKNNLCFEEYIEELKTYTKDEPLVFDDDGEEYSIYYVKAEKNSETEVPVPKHSFYTVSGNNIDGFIVTVEP